MIEQVKNKAEEILDLNVAYKEDHITKDELTELENIYFTNIISYSSKFSEPVEMFIYASLLKSLFIRRYIIQSQPKPPKEFLKGFVASGDETITLPDGEKMTLQKPAEINIFKTK